MTKMTISKLKTNFRKKMKEEHGLKVSITRETNVITMEYENKYKSPYSKYVTSATYHNGVIIVNEGQYASYNQEFTGEMFDFWQKVAELKELDALIFPGTRSVFVRKIEQEGFQKGKELVEEEKWKKYIGTLPRGYYIKELKAGSVEKILRFNKIIYDVLHVLKNEDVTMKYEQRNVEEYTVYSYYYQGINDVFSTKITSEGVTFHFGEEMVEVSDENKIKETLKDYFTKVYNKRKVKNIFNYPRKYFDEYVSTKLSLSAHKDEIYEYLKSVYMPKEIEEYFAKIQHQEPNKTSYRISWSNEPTLFILMDYVFVLEQQPHAITMYKIDELEKAQAYLKHLIVTRIEQIMDSEIQRMGEKYQKTLI